MASVAVCSLARPADVPSPLLSWNPSGAEEPNDAGLIKKIKKNKIKSNFCAFFFF